MWIYPGYDHDKNVKRFKFDSQQEFPVVYISFPSAKDKTWDDSHYGYSTIKAITFARWSWFEKWKALPLKNGGGDYEKEKNKLSKRILQVLCENVPGIKDSVNYLELSTPITMKDLSNYQKGEMYGIDHTPQRFRQRWLKPSTKIKNFFLTGQDITTAGVSSALLSGFLTASSILRKNLTHMIKK